MVEYQDNPKAQKLVFGPYATTKLANDFADELPTPQKGGRKRYVTLQPFTHNEAHMVRDLIMAHRERHVEQA
ncbi:MAG: hypothetical protein B7Z80_02730 [Rhodospirillales bacterium 20-64-7]|nr:MAG: hypothetical protein B7Z80_02730 [Rhodospirillales bacterium 20-64-7]